jgi:TPR repeat protein
MAQAVSWYQKAAAQGQAQAEFALGNAYEHGKGGLRKDKALAREWYQKSADKGYELAREKLE